MFGMSDDLWKEMHRAKGLQYTPWQEKFIFLKKINDEWVFLQRVHMRHELFFTDKGGLYISEDYALNELEMLAKTDPQ